MGSILFFSKRKVQYHQNGKLKSYQIEIEYFENITEPVDLYDFTKALTYNFYKQVKLKIQKHKCFAINIHK